VYFIYKEYVSPQSNPARSPGFSITGPLVSFDANIEFVTTIRLRAALPKARRTMKQTWSSARLSFSCRFIKISVFYGLQPPVKTSISGGRMLFSILYPLRSVCRFHI
jgi:hypothetical protein